MSKIEKIVVVKTDGDWLSYQTPKIEEYECGPGEVALSHSYLRDSFRKLLGGTLTIIDASITDKVQNKAMKDVVRKLYSDELAHSAEMAFDQEKLRELGAGSCENPPPKGYTIDDVLGVEK